MVRMETKQEALLCRVVVNHLFLSQFEPFRACLHSLYEINPELALGILQAILQNGGQLAGVLWSDTVRSSSHLAWLCLGELSALEGARRFSFSRGRPRWVSDPLLIFDSVEFLLLVELLNRLSTTRSSTLSQESDDRLWDLGRKEFRKHGESVSERSGSGSIPGKSRKNKSMSLGQGGAFAQTFDGIATGSKASQSAETIAGTGRLGFGAAPEQEAVQAKGESSKEGEGLEATGLMQSKEIGNSEDTERNRVELEKAGLEFIQELAATGLHRLIERLHVLDSASDNGGREHDEANEGRPGEASPGEGELRNDGPSSSTQPQARSDFLAQDKYLGRTLSVNHQTWLRKLTLLHPELLQTLCSNIQRQHSFKPHLSKLDRRRSAEAPRNNFSFETDQEDPADDPSRLNGDRQYSYEDVDGVWFELGDVISREVQTAHLAQMKVDVLTGRLGQAIQHLRYLHAGCGVPESNYREVMHLIINGVKTNVDPGRLRDRHDDATVIAIHEQVLASSSVLLLALLESIQDDLILEVAKEKRAASEQSLPPPFEKIHNQLEMRRAVASTINVSTDPSWIRTCKVEMFHYGRVMGAHVLETVMEAAFMSIKTLQFQQTADVLASYPRLQPLVTVMGWDLLAGNTSARRQMIEMLWTSRPKSGRLEGESGAMRPTEEVSCIDDLCDQLCYRLELAYFAALVNSGGSWQAGGCKIFGSSKGKLSNRNQGDQPPADPFVANLVLERLAMHSPLRVIFDVVPTIKLQDALQLIEMQPTGSSTTAFLQRQQDLELLHMHFGIQAAVRVLGIMEANAVEDQIEQLQRRAKYFLLELRRHLDALITPVRKLWMMNIIVSLLHMDDLSPADSSIEGLGPWDDQEDSGGPSKSFAEGDKPTAVAFVGEILMILRHSISSVGSEAQGKRRLRQGSTSRATLEGVAIVSVPDSVSKAWERKAASIQDFVDDWEWRLAVLQRLSPSSHRQWQWREALAVLRAAPSTLLNMCVQRAQYDLGEEAVNRFDIPPEEAASLQLAEWVDGAVARSSVDDAVSRAAEGASTSDDALNNVVLRLALPPLASVLLCLDIAAASARSVISAKHLLDRASVLLSQISQGGSKRQSTSLADQKQEAFLMLMVKRLLQRFEDLLELDKSRPLQSTLSGTDIVSSGVDVVRQGPKQRALGILHQIIEDAHDGKRQFLSGKLHNLVKALSDEDDDSSSSKQVISHSSDRKQIAMEHGLVLGLGFQSPPQASSLPRSGSGDHGEVSPMVIKSAGKWFLGPLGNKPTAYLSAFILYIATVGDIVDGVDTTHDYNFFSLVYERPNDLLTRLVFERGSADAAGHIAELMGEDLVHQVITACVPPVYPPKAGKGWASIPRLPTRRVQSTGVLQSGLAGALRNDKAQLYVLQRDVVKHLATLSPVRAILACVFGNSRFTMNIEDAGRDSTKRDSQQQLDADRWFYEFALEQSERYPTLNRWIQIQANLQRLSESPISSKKSNHIDSKKEERRSTKRMREPEEEAESDDEQEKIGGSVSTGLQRPALDKSLESLDSQIQHITGPHSILLDWENEGPYEEAVHGLMEEGKLVDALALADRYLGNGAPDQLLQLLIERGEDTGSQSTSSWQSHGGSHHNLWNSSWQYCIRLRNKKLAATLALKYFHRWELDAAIDVFTMCSCHLEPADRLYEEVIRVKQSLQQYGRILRADSRFSNWREVEALCQSDPEGLALRLASKGAVSAALSVAESFNLPDVTRRELQGRQLVQLLTSDPTTAGGPAEGLRFLGSLHNPADALPVAMAAMEQLPNLRSKQLLVHFFLKRRVGTLSEEEHARLDRLALGLRMLGALPLPWQQRCSALHEHPRLILETLLMWKQLKAASQLLQAFPSLRDNDLIISYAAKAITPSYPAVERRTYSTSTASKPTPRLKTNFTSGISTLQREARRAFSWTSRDTSSKITPKEIPSRKRKGSMLPQSQIAAWEAMFGISEERSSASAAPQEGYERLAPVTMGDEWVLTGDSTKDDGVRSSHRYESAPSAILFKSLLSLCSEEIVAAKAAVDLCIAQIKKLLCIEQLPLDASSEIIERAFYATEAFVQILLHARAQLRDLVGRAQATATSSVSSGDSSQKESNEEASGQSSSISSESPQIQKVPDLLQLADVWLNRVEVLQSLLGAGVTASLDDIVDEDSAIKLRDRLIVEERYSMAVYTCTKCKIDALPVWEDWGHALLRIEHYAQARGKFKQALQLLKGDPGPFILQIIFTLESGPPVDISAVRNLYIHMAKSVFSSSDDSLSADAYLNVLYMPSFTKSDRSRRSSEDSADSFAVNTIHLLGEEPIRSNLDGVRYEECVHYLQEYARQDLLAFQFRHGRYYDACLLFFPPDSVPPPPLPSPHQTQVVSSSPQRPDPLATDYGSIDDLCDYCVSYGAIPVLERVLSARSNNLDSSVAQHTAAALARICSYCEIHRHFNHLYRFQVLKKDYIAAGLCCIQLFLNSSHQEEALRHLERARGHFDQGLATRQGDLTKGVAKANRGKLPSDKLTEEELNKFTGRINIQMEVVRTFSESDGPLWKTSLFGNPNDADTFKRRCDVAEELIERNFDLAFQIIYDFGLPAVYIYAGVAASLAQRRKSSQLTELLRNIKGTIDSDDLDQVLGAAINVYAEKHRERPDRLIDMLSSSHRKVLACVICGRLKSAFQIASRSGSVTDVQYVGHQARQSGAKSVQEMCKQWLAKNS